MNRQMTVLDIPKTALITGPWLILVVLIWLSVSQVILQGMAQLTGEILDLRHGLELFTGGQDFLVVLAHGIMLSGLFGRSHRLVESPPQVSGIDEAEVLTAGSLRKTPLSESSESLQCSQISIPPARTLKATSPDSDHSRHIPRLMPPWSLHRQTLRHPGG